jgi:hypothetical protein
MLQNKYNFIDIKLKDPIWKENTTKTEKYGHGNLAGLYGARVTVWEEVTTL